MCLGRGEGGGGAATEVDCLFHNESGGCCLLGPGGHKEMSSILADHAIAPSYLSPKCGGEGVAGSQPMSTAVHMEPK